MTKKIFRSILLASLIALLTGLILVTGLLYDYFAGMQKNRLKTELDLAASAVEQSGLSYLSAVKTDGFRLTWISADGAVLYDTAANADSMENHADRQEIQDAMQNGYGESERYSATLTRKTLYAAQRLPDGTVLRVSMEYATVFSLVVGMIQPSLVIFFLLMLLSGVLAGRMAKHIVNPLNTLDLEHPLENEAYDELSPLLRRIDHLHSQVEAQMRELRRKTDEFVQITDNMQEGLVLLDEKNRIVSINRAALRLFSADKSCIGQDYLTLDRSHETDTAIQTAMKNGHSEIRTEKNGREYQLDISRIETDGKTRGAVLLAFDVTDRVFAERNRREFTANVSHELKTPLQSILGSAELIQNGLVKQDDMPRFIGHIRTEAARLVALIDDILRLSQLDENREMECEKVGLRALAAEIEEQLQYTADAKGVRLELEPGNEVTVHGVRKLLAEVLFNLCDNAVKYNREGGRVTVGVSEEEKNAILTVSDTGIGISPEHQDRVFERFYRVDKSRSKESGGTGLGLSIVKHAVQYHHGTVSLTSKPGEGTVFTVTLPKEAAQPKAEPQAENA